ncbi:MAG: carbohydrate ABC transporter permease [Spirochaetaceae bacterium]|nr:carbohydrate ABC transporter permease [Spirochaetaceae bacterium]
MAEIQYKKTGGITHSQRKVVIKVVSYFVLTLVGFLMIYPLIWMVGASFKPDNAEVFRNITPFTLYPSIRGYIVGWQTATEFTFTRYFFNSFAIVVPKMIFTVISCTLASYAFSRFWVPGKKIWFALLIGTLLLPDTVLRIPQFLLFRQLGWLNSFLPLTVPSLFAVDSFFVFMLVQFFRGIPKDLSESATIDGCNSLQTLLYVLVPVLKPAIISVALFQFMWTMNDFMGPLIYISSVSMFPVSLALRMSMDASSIVDWPAVLAMSTAALVPSLTLFFIAQRYFVEGIATTGMKG